MTESIRLHDNTHANVTYISNSFIDNFMAKAPGDYVKIYLYLLRCMSSKECHFSIGSISESFGYMETDIHRALSYWEKLHLLHLEHDYAGNLCGIQLLNDADRAQMTAHPADIAISASDSNISLSMNSEKSPAQVLPFDRNGMTTTATPDSTSQAIPSPGTYTPEQIEHFKKGKNSAELLFIAERYLGHTLNSCELSNLCYWKQTLGFSQDLIIYLMEVCISGKRANMQTMNQTAISWYNAGIRNVDEARAFQAKNQSKRISSGVLTAVQNAFGISGRSLGEREKTFVRKWINEWSFQTELVTEACSRSLAKTHQASFEYADRILENWHKQNVFTPNDIAVADLAYQESKAPVAPKTTPKRAASGFTNFKGRTYDFQNLERQLLSR